MVLGTTVSSWKSVASGVPQGSVLGPLLFLVYVNDLLDCVGEFGRLFADDSKIVSIIKDMACAVRLQRGIDAISDWTRLWLMRLNAKKCVIMHFGRKNSRAGYTVEDVNTGERVDLTKSDCERDLGVFISCDLRWRNHIDEIVARANRVLGMLVRSFACRDVEPWKLLYVSLVRPHLEYASVVWSPHLKGDVSALEKVQERATRIPTALRNLPYEERLKAWGLTSLEVRRSRGDLIQLYKNINGLDTIEWHTGPQFAPIGPTRSSTRNDLCLRREAFASRTRNDHGHFVSVRHEFFLNRVVEHWNRLSNYVIHAPSLNSFKARIDSSM